MKVLLTGSQGLVGQRIVSFLYKNKNVKSVFATHRCSQYSHTLLLSSKKINYLKFDICDKNDVISNIKKINPNVIIHCAALASVDYCEENPKLCFNTNVNGTKHLIEASKITNSFFIFLSTDFVFGHSQSKKKYKIKENDANIKPLSVYGKSKLMAEQLLQLSNINHTIIRTSLVFGISKYNSRKNIAEWVYSNLKNEKTIRVITDHWRTPTFVDDLAIACVQQCLLKKEGIFHVSGRDILTPYDFACILADTFKLNKKLIHKITSHELNQLAERPNYSALEISKAETMLKYQPQSLENALLEIKKSLL